MGDRGSKIAAKQAELSRRKRRDKQPSIPAGSLPPPQSEAGNNPAVAAQQTPQPGAPTLGGQGSGGRVPAARPFIVRRSKGALDVAPTYPYLKTELRNIGIVMAGLGAILVALTFILR